MCFFGGFCSWQSFVQICSNNTSWGCGLSGCHCLTQMSTSPARYPVPFAVPAWFHHPTWARPCYIYPHGSATPIPGHHGSQIFGVFRRHGQTGRASYHSCAYQCTVHTIYCFPPPFGRDFQIFPQKKCFNRKKKHNRTQEKVTQRDDMYKVS